MTAVQQQDLVLASFPFSGAEGGKIRPAVIISRSEYNASSKDVLLCALTSNPEAKPFSLPVSRENLSEGALALKSRIRVDKIASVDKSRLIKKFARLDDRTFDALTGKLFDLVRRMQGK
ncbi:MAG TPA: type II toxin-antitoxin system PemK/MazF family toxin [archaeon]|nr:type II toxin-antitoxin system PemK/MazF family toxin [archaeon]